MFPGGTVPFCLETASGRPVILHRTEHFVVVNKPAGMPTHPGPGCAPGSSLMTWLRRQLGRWVYPVHRLDAPVSGALVMALTPEVASLLAGQFAGRTVTKTYVGVCRGWLPDSGKIDHPLGRLDSSDSVIQAPQEAITVFSTLARWELPIAVRPYPTSRYCLVELQPLTGRTHQLRRHLASLSHPLIGDTRYGDGAHNRAYRSQLQVHRLLLHARDLEFQSPDSGEDLRFTAPFDEVWQGLLANKNRSFQG